MAVKKRGGIEKPPTSREDVYGQQSVMSSQLVVQATIAHVPWMTMAVAWYGAVPTRRSMVIRPRGYREKRVR